MNITRRITRRIKNGITSKVEAVEIYSFILMLEKVTELNNTVKLLVTH